MSEDTTMPRIDRIDSVEQSYFFHLQKQVEQAQIAANAFAQFLTAKYGLHDGDQILDDGRIARVVKQEE